MEKNGIFEIFDLGYEEFLILNFLDFEKKIIFYIIYFF